MEHECRMMQGAVQVQKYQSELAVEVYNQTTSDQTGGSRRRMDQT